MPTSCPDCQRTVHVGRTTCLYCGGTIAAPQEPDHDTAPCPRCRTMMRSVEIGGIWIDVCAGCGGTWYDRDEFEAHLDNVVDRVANTPAGSPKPPTTGDLTQLPCPRCDTSMERRNFDHASGVIVDVCREHGAFLDPGELAAIARYVASGRQAKVHRTRQETAANDVAIEKRGKRRKTVRHLRKMRDQRFAVRAARSLFW